jgi:hypothetical protein
MSLLKLWMGRSVRGKGYICPHPNLDVSWLSAIKW